MNQDITTDSNTNNKNINMSKNIIDERKTIFQNIFNQTFDNSKEAIKLKEVR